MPILQNRNISNKLPNFIQQRTRKRKQMSEGKFDGKRCQSKLIEVKKKICQFYETYVTESFVKLTLRALSGAHVSEGP